MVMQLIDWMGRILTVKQVGTYIIQNVLSPIEQYNIDKLNEAQQKYINQGMSEEKAKVYALYDLDYIETDPATICRIRGIQ